MKKRKTKKIPVGPYILTRPPHRKQIFFKGGLRHNMELSAWIVSMSLFLELLFMFLVIAGMYKELSVSILGAGTPRGKSHTYLYLKIL